VLLFEGDRTERFIADAKTRFETATPPPLLSTGLVQSLTDSLQRLQAAGARLVTGGEPLPQPGARHANTLLRVSGRQFLDAPDALQGEAFGSAALLVVVRDDREAAMVLDHLEGNLTGSIYSDSAGADEPAYAQLAPRLAHHVGRFLNDKMPTGVGVSSAMNHGGPYPATGHPGFTAVGVPAAMHRFGALRCYDHVRPNRLPPCLRDKNPTGHTWRLIDGQWTTKDV
jgi:NADP-dependent aldehyde dehydrogenase